MSNKLEVSFNSPQCGWMSIGFDDGLSEFHTTTAHAPHEKALAELLLILSALLDPQSAPRDEYVLHWNRSPEEFDFYFARTGENVLMEIYQYPSRRQREPENREKVFAHRGNLRDVAEAFHKTFTQLYKDRDTDEFEFNWRQPFPLAEFEIFESNLKTAQT
ncbi:MAG TPA: hypothetical protein VK400_16940 [Pyrinomonadaceae bacterium]|nr:hypothetical protein [Pyrinomonadaceae bacterium]